MRRHNIGYAALLQSSCKDGTMVRTCIALIPYFAGKSTFQPWYAFQPGQHRFHHWQHCFKLLPDAARPANRYVAS